MGEVVEFWIEFLSVDSEFLGEIFDTEFWVV